MGIGTNAPTAPLTVIANNTSKGIIQKTGILEIDFYTTISSAYVQNGSPTNLSFATGNGGAKITILHSNGFVGVNTSFSAAHLDVNGTLRLRGIGAGENKVLTSDANGNEPGSLITAGDAGFAVYKTNTCLPAGTDISTKLTPIGVFGNTYHPCVESGNYLVQVSSKAAANGPVFITVETGQPTAVYDLPAQASNFGTIGEGLRTLTYNVDCQSIEDAAETCTALSNYLDYNKSTWHVFKTPSYLDYVILFIADANANTTKKFGIKIYKGDARSTPYTSLPLVGACDSLQTSGQASAYKFFRCEDISPNTTYSIQIFYYCCPR